MSTLSDLQTRRAQYVLAEAAILKGQEYQVGEGGNHRRLRRADLAEVRAAIADLELQIAAASANPNGVRRVYYGRPA
jgi:hypothetical protein